MKVIKKLVVVAVLALTSASAVIATAPSSAAAATRQFEGTVVSVDRSARTFRLRDSERGTVRIKVTGGTRFHRVAGFAGLHRGLTRIEATVRRSNGAWVATLVERSGGGGGHSADD
jgi:hypothetical protein